MRGLKTLKRACLTSAKSVGVYGLLRNSGWRRQRLLILCYHGISVADEHEWRPPLYMPPDAFAARMETLERKRYHVLPLEEAVERLYAGDLPDRSVALTFDDGGYDFYKSAYPILERFGFPATVYLTTFYCDFNRPIFNLVCSYILWKRQDATFRGRPLVGEEIELDLKYDS